MTKMERSMIATGVVIVTKSLTVIGLIAIGKVKVALQTKVSIISTNIRKYLLTSNNGRIASLRQTTRNCVMMTNGSTITATCMDFAMV